MTKPFQPESKTRYFQRELSWLSFNERVLEEAFDPANPLLERLNFLAIFSGNLDEFHMIRASGLKRLIDAGYKGQDEYGYTPAETLQTVRDRTRALIRELYKTYKKLVAEDLPRHGVEIVRYENLSPEERRYADEYFESTVFPLMTPMAVDQGHPFPILPSKTLSFAVSVKRGSQTHFVLLPVPTVVPRLYRLPAHKHRFVLLEEIIRGNIPMFFRGYKILEGTLFRIIRDADIMIEEEYADNLLKAIEAEVKKRPRARAVLMEIEKDASAQMLEMLSRQTALDDNEILRLEGDLDLTYLWTLLGLVELSSLRYPPFIARRAVESDIFERIRRGDFLLHHPFQSFAPVVDFIDQAARDRDVLAIKMTLYRVDSDSAIVRSLKEAAGNGKQVTVLVELKARFDEEKNILWARELEQAGCHVIYGIPKIKIHSKIALVVRREEGSIRQYVHLSTGNYNERTSRVYTDLGLFTANDDFARDISETFNVISGYSMPPRWRKVTSAPYDLRRYFETLIGQEIENQKKYGNGLILAKFNSLADRKMIDCLYGASCAGVKIRLMVRGICCLVPGVKGLSENIEVRNVVGRFLEHSRIYFFNSNDSRRYFLSSADWMSRNLDRRIEILFPVENEDLKKHLEWLLRLYWKDNTKSRILQSNGVYQKPAPVSEAERVDVQSLLINHYGTDSRR